MDMQREDFLKLCRGPADGGVWVSPIAGGARPIATHSGFHYLNQSRILEDWFPAGHIFTFLGANCMSRGVVKEGWNARLEVLALNPSGGYKTYSFSVREALSIAQQGCVDTINWLDELERENA